MIIGLNGLKGSGKDTVGQYLVDNWGYTRASFAEKLKTSAAELFDVLPESWEQWKNEPETTVSINRRSVPIVNLTVREFLQRYGTESHRDIFGSDFWVDEALKGLDPNKKTVFTDARFENELERIKSLGGYNVQILRPGVFTKDSHASEVPPPQHLIDYAIDNDGSFDKLYSEVDTVVKVLRELNESYNLTV